MKKSLHILLAAALCLLIFCAACGKDGTIDNNIDNTPDNTPITDPDTTLPDSTADDKQNDTTPPDSTADDKQGDNDAAAPAGDNNAPVEDSKPDDTQQNDDIPYQLDPAVITEEYVISLIEEVEEWCNCLPFYSFNFEDASQLSADSLLRTFVVLTHGEGLMTPINYTADKPAYYAQYAAADDITAELGKWFKDIEFDITQCSTYVRRENYITPDQVLTTYETRGVHLLDIKIRDLAVEGNIVTFSAELKKDWIKEYALEFYDGGYYFLKAKEIESPSADNAQTNEKALKAYYDFLKNETAATYWYDKTEYTIDTLAPKPNYTISKYAFVDFGSDGVFEMVLEDVGQIYYTILFYDNDQLYIDYVSHRSLQMLKINGICHGSSGGSSGSYVKLTLSPEKGDVSTIIGKYQESPHSSLGIYYRIYGDITDGEFAAVEERNVSKEEFDEFRKSIRLIPEAKFYPIEYSSALGAEFNVFEFYGLFEYVKQSNDDTQKPDEVVAVDYFAAFDISKYDYRTSEDNIKAVQAYYDFLFNNTEAYDTYTSKLVSLVDVAEEAHPLQSFWVNLQNLELAFVDFGADGVVEMVFNDGNRYFKNWVILFYENHQLYLDTVNHRSMGGIRKNGFYDSYAFFSSSFSVDGGQSDVSLFVCSTSKEYPYDKKYYTYFEIADGEFTPTERTEITEVEYQSLLAAYNKVPEAVWYSVTDTFESLLSDANHLMIFADINNQPTTMYNPK